MSDSGCALHAAFLVFDTVPQGLQSQSSLRVLSSSGDSSLHSTATFHFHRGSSRGIGALRVPRGLSASNGLRFGGPMPRSVAFFAVPNFLK